LNTVSGIAGLDTETVPLDMLQEKLSRDAACDIVLRLARYRELCRRGDPAIWEEMVARTGADSTVYDFLLLGTVLLGKEFDFASISRSSERSEGGLPPEVPGISDWLLPAGDRDRWVRLSTGTNAIYRLLAVEAVETWAQTDETRQVVGCALKDDYLAVRRAALGKVALLSPREQIDICREYMEWRRAKALPNNLAKETAQWMLDQVYAVLKEARSQEAEEIESLRRALSESLRIRD